VPDIEGWLMVMNEVLPQRPQNFTPEANRAPHFEQLTISGSELGYPAVPYDDEGLLGVPAR
jgi:hypothetical protein